MDRFQTVPTDSDEIAATRLELMLLHSDGWLPYETYYDHGDLKAGTPVRVQRAGENLQLKVCSAWLKPGFDPNSKWAKLALSIAADQIRTYKGKNWYLAGLEVPPEGVRPL